MLVLHDLGMKSATEYLTFNTREREQFVCITPQVTELVGRSGIQEGFCFGFGDAHHVGRVCERPRVRLIEDIKEWLRGLAPTKDYRHHQTGDDNGEAHLKNLVMHHQVILPITAGRLDLGPWQQVFYAEFDGQRRKRVIVKAIGE